MIRYLALFLTVPLLAAEPDRKALKPGLVASFDGVTRLEPTPAFTHQVVSPNAMNWKATWDGYIQIVTPGEYTFCASSFGRYTLTLTLDKPIVIDVPHIRAPNEKPKTVKLDPGYYRFHAVLENVATEGSIPAKPNFFGELLWQGPGFQQEPIPWFFFSHLPSERPERFAKDQQHAQGKFLFDELACAKCHGGSTVERTGPNLSKIGSRVYMGWLDAWLADPRKLRPHTTMPKMFTDDDRGVAERYAVTQYLASLGGPMLAVKIPLLDVGNAKSYDAGKKLFTSAGCVACHGSKLAGTMKANDDDDEPPPFDASSSFSGFGGNPQSVYALGGIGSKTNVDELTKYLKDPLKTNPHGRMPNMNLTSEEAKDLARHLVRNVDETIKNPYGVDAPKLTAPALAGELKLKADASWKAIGQHLFTSKGCVNCHAVDGAPDRFPIIQLRKPDAGCLSDTPTVKYTLDATQRAALKEFVAKPTVPAAPNDSVRMTLKRFNCLACHSRDGEGGVGSELQDAMKKLEAAGNEDDVAPPRLTGIGHKATTAWLNDVLLNGGKARPWMNLRMPQYGEKNVGHLPAAFAACEGIATDTAAVKPKPTAAMIDAGRKLAGKEGLGCVACHDINGLASGGTRGPDLALTDKHVRHEWYVRWMHNPQRLAPGTKMPQNFTDGTSVSKMLDGKADAQIEALWAYFSLGPGLPLPSGMNAGTKGIPVTVTDTPVLLRTFMPDAGTRSIAVGFPGAAYVFDSHANRVAYAWEGNFLDASPVWDARGGKPAKLLGVKYFTPPPGQPFAVGKEKPDFGKQATDYAYGAEVPFNKIFTGPLRTHFHGYTLNDGVPTFEYSIDDEKGEASVRVLDTPRPVKASIANGLQRTMMIDASGAKDRSVWLQVASGVKEAKVVGDWLVLPQEKDRALAVKAKLPAGAAWDKNGVLKLPSTGTYELVFTVWSLPSDDEALLKTLP